MSLMNPATAQFDRLHTLAAGEVETTVAELPDTLQPAARTVLVSFLPRPDAGLRADGIEPDTLGLFCGAAMADPPGVHEEPTRIILFLENLWDFAGTDEAAFAEEVRITYLHELGHFFGWDEDDLEERGLD